MQKSGLEYIIQEYLTCQDFCDIYISLTHDPHITVESFTIVDSFLFRSTRLCIPNSSLHGHLIWRIYARDRWPLWSLQNHHHDGGSILLA